MSGISNTYGAAYGTGYDDYYIAKRTMRTEQGSDSNEMMDAIAKRKEEILEKVRKGETEPSIPIGVVSFTFKQWNKLMKSVDRAIDDMQERIRADEEEYEKKMKEEKMTKSDEMRCFITGKRKLFENKKI